MTCEAGQRVVAGIADEGVIRCITRDRIIAAASDERFDRYQRIDIRSGSDGDGDCARAIEGRCDAGRGEVGVIDQIIAGAAIKRIIAETTRERVITRIADNRVCTGVADDTVIVLGGEDVFNVGDKVRIRAVDRSGCLRRAVQRDGEAACAIGDIGIIERVASADCPVDRVIAEAACERVGVAIAGEFVGKIGPDQIFDVADNIASGADRILPEAGAERDRDACGRVRVCCGIDAGAAIEIVIAIATPERVIAHSAAQCIVADAARE